MPAVPMLGSALHVLILVFCTILSFSRSASVLGVKATLAPASLNSQDYCGVFHDILPQYGTGDNIYTLHVKRGAGVGHDTDDDGWIAISGYVVISDRLSEFHERVRFLQSCGLLPKLLGELHEGMKLRLCTRGSLLLPGDECSEAFTFRDGTWISEVDGRTAVEDGRGQQDYSIPLLSNEDMINNRRARLLHLLGRASADTTVGIMDDILFKERYIEKSAINIYV